MSNLTKVMRLTTGEKDVFPLSRVQLWNKPLPDEENPHNLNRSIIFGFVFSDEPIQENDEEMWECEVILRKVKKYSEPKHTIGDVSSSITSEYMWQPDFWETKNDG